MPTNQFNYLIGHIKKIHTKKIAVTFRITSKIKFPLE